MKKLALVFPGQGSQYVGMGKELYNNYKIAQDIFDEANECLDFDLKKLCFEGNLEELSKTENTQPAILTVSYAMFKVFMEEFKVNPTILAGHSLGEISALTCSGSIKFTDALKIVRKRGEFMQEAVPLGVGGMAAVNGIDSDIIERECKIFSNEKQFAAIANYNTLNQTVISGHQNILDKLSQKFSTLGGTVTKLNVSAPFHSKLMDPVCNKLKDELKMYSYNKLMWPVISNINGLPYTDESVIIENLSLQVAKAVKWNQTMEYLKDNRVDIIVEIGPKIVLKNLMKKSSLNSEIFAYDNLNDLQKLRENILKEIAPNPEALIIKCLTEAVCTKNYNFNNDKYYSGVVAPYNEIESLLDELEKKKEKPTINHAREAVIMLKSVFKTKGVALEQQIDRLNLIFEETGMKEFYSEFITVGEQ